jgi:hypothetical protein
MLNVETEPLAIAFKREVAKMRDRDATDLRCSSCGVSSEATPTQGGRPFFEKATS